MDDEEDDDEDQGEVAAYGDYDDRQRLESKLNEEGMAVNSEMTYRRFVDKCWNKLKAKAGKKNSDSYQRFDPALVWTEIKSYIKGSVEALDSHIESDHKDSTATQRNEALKKVYFALGRQRTQLAGDAREKIWELYLEYEKLKRQLRCWDEGDLVRDLYRRLRDHGRSNVLIHQAFVDEVQDFTQAELWLVLKLVQIPNACFLAGDTAQTIARGVGFRFTDLKGLFHRLKEEDVQVPEVSQLVHNYRSHTGVLQLAAAVVQVIEKFFPASIDSLEADQGLFPGPKPKILLMDKLPDLTVRLLGHQRMTAGGAIEFGAQQVILVRSDESRRNLPPELLNCAIVLTVFEAKGLEFDDVLLWNFFTDSAADNEWRCLTGYWEEKKASVEEDASELQDGTSLPRHVRQTSFEDMAGIKKPRADKFKEEKHKILESELKALYCAITRARVNVWFVDFDEGNHHARDPAYSWFLEAGLCDKDDGSGQGSASGLADDRTSFAQRSTPEEWLERGMYFYQNAEQQVESRQGYYESAAMCFKQAQQPDLVKKAEALLEVMKASSKSQEASGRKGQVEIRGAYFKAAQSCLEARLPYKAALCLGSAQDHESAAEIFIFLAEKGGNRKAFKKAALCYQRMNRVDKAAEYFWEAKEFSRAVRLLREAQRYEYALELIQNQSPDAASGSLSSFEERQLELLRGEVTDLVRNVVRQGVQSSTGSISPKVLSALKYLSVDEQLRWLDSFGASEAKLLRITGAGGVHRNAINGDYKQKGELHGASMFQKQDDPDTWLYFAQTRWTVGDTASKVAGESNGLEEKGADAGQVYFTAPQGSNLPESDKEVTWTQGSQLLSLKNASGKQNVKDIVAVLTRDGQWTAAAEKCLDNGDYLLGAECMTQAPAEQHDLKKLKEPLARVNCFLDYCARELGGSFPKDFPPSSSSTMLALGAWATNDDGQRGTLVKRREEGNDIFWTLQLFDGTTVEGRQRGLTAQGSRAGLESLLQQSRQLMAEAGYDVDGDDERALAAAKKDQAGSSDKLTENAKVVDILYRRGQLQLCSAQVSYSFVLPQPPYPI